VKFAEFLEFQVQFPCNSLIGAEGCCRYICLQFLTVCMFPGKTRLKNLLELLVFPCILPCSCREWFAPDWTLRHSVNEAKAQTKGVAVHNLIHIGSVIAAEVRLAVAGDITGTDFV
jgi:hypothetical protein